MLPTNLGFLSRRRIHPVWSTTDTRAGEIAMGWPRGVEAGGFGGSLFFSFSYLSCWFCGSIASSLKSTRGRLTACKTPLHHPTANTKFATRALRLRSVHTNTHIRTHTHTHARTHVAYLAYGYGSFTTHACYFIPLCIL